MCKFCIVRSCLEPIHRSMELCIGSTVALQSGNDEKWYVTTNKYVRSDPKLAIFMGMIGNMKNGYAADERGNCVEHISSKLLERHLSPGDPSEN
jgi:hypothetical protein